MTNLTQMDAFFTTVSTPPRNVATVQGFFVGNIAGPPNYPNVGLTTGGPQFTFQNGIGILFTALFDAFPDMVLSYANGPLAPRPTAGQTIAVEAVLDTGEHQKKWKPKGTAISPPIGLINPAGGASTLPLCAVFTFDGTPQCLIKNLSLYFDRWKMAMDLWDRANPPHLA